MKILIRFLALVFSLLLVAHFMPGVSVDGLYTALIVALIIGLLNVTIKPLLQLLALPITILTFGLFALVINGLLFWFVASFVDGFTVDGFFPALFGALFVSLISWLLNKLV